MKGRIWFIAGIVLFFVIMFLVEYHQPKRFVWTPTFGHNDKQPFGCSVFDAEVAGVWPEGYDRTRETFYQLSLDSTPRALLSVSLHLDLKETDVNALLKLAEGGSKILLVSSSFSPAVEDTLHIKCSSSFFSPASFRKYVADAKAKERIYWVGDSIRYAPRTFEYYPQLCSSFFHQSDSLAEPLARIRVAGEGDSTWMPVALSIPVGEGEIILASTPLLFTNYGMLDGSNGTYLFRLLSRMSDLPLVRTEVYGSPHVDPQSPLRYFLSQRPLRWAVYLTMTTILLFMIFTARRKQRAIPMVREPGNQSLEFAELIGTLYFRKQDHASLVCKKFAYFAEQLRRYAQVDVEDEEDDQYLAYRIAQKTGLNQEQIQELFQRLRPVVHGEQGISEELMKEYIDRMNEITNHL